MTFEVDDLAERVVFYPTTFLFRNLDDFFDRWPELRSVVVESRLLRETAPMAWRSGPQTEPVWYRLGPDGQDLWSAAVAVTVHLTISHSLVPRVLGPFLEATGQ